MKLTGRKLATILAALRAFQERPSHKMPHFAGHKPLCGKEIDALCEQLNADQSCRSKFLLVFVQGGLIASITPYGKKDEAIKKARTIWKKAEPEEDDIKVMQIGGINKEAVPFWDPRDDKNL